MSSLSRSLSLPLDLERRTIERIVDGNEEVTESKKFEVQRIIHKHPSICSKDALNDLGNGKVCRYCIDRSHDGSAYGCIPCNHIFRKSCDGLPQKVRHSLHPAHLLEFFRTPNEFSFCDVCQEIILKSKYKCTLCDFNLHTRCALSNTFEKPQDHHNHSFVLLKPTYFTCDCCGADETEKKCVSCVCTSCQLQVHKKCSYSLPLTVKHRRHCHELHLSYSFQIGFDYAKMFCKFCFHKMNNVFCIYQCTDCAYIAHASCVNSRSYAFESDEDRVEIENEEFTLNSVKPEEDGKEEQIYHASHPHCLIFSSDEGKLDAICNGCVRPISVPHYTCGNDQCNFYLHKQCFELPKKIQHPLHTHPLRLKCFDISGNLINGFTCYACGLGCNGFQYSCKKCNFNLDVGCSLFSHDLNHEGHKCPLVLIDTSRGHVNTLDKRKCSACDSYCTCLFLCEGCNFKIDLKCASLPKMVRHECPKHKWNAHPLILTYHAINDGLSGDYYCDICEETRDENHWFYYCEDCNYSLHPRCILGEDLQKHGATCKIESHSHPVRLIKKPKRDHICNSCEGPCKDPSIYFCAQCNIYIHQKKICSL